MRPKAVQAHSERNFERASDVSVLSLPEFQISASSVA
jgi:hypothetical protein